MAKHIYFHVLPFGLVMSEVWTEARQLKIREIV